jgi:fatty acyl-CoA reductase
VEKLLRVQPNVGGLYLLIRPRDGKNVEQRLKELLESSLFEDLRLNMEPCEWDVLKSKIHAVEGSDMSRDNRGMEVGNCLFCSLCTAYFFDFPI